MRSNSISKLMIVRWILHVRLRCEMRYNARAALPQIATCQSNARTDGTNDWFVTLMIVLKKSYRFTLIINKKEVLVRSNLLGDGTIILPSSRNDGMIK